MAEPCFKCGTRADIGCKHQPASGSLPSSIVAQQKKKQKAAHPNSLWGHKGNPAGPARQRMIEAAKRAMKARDAQS